MSKYETVDEYIESQPERARNKLKELRAYILEAVPDEEELINYNISAFALVKGVNREQQIMIAAYEKHVGLYPHPTVMEFFFIELKQYKHGKGSVQFPIDESLPKELIINMIKYRKTLLSNKSGVLRFTMSLYVIFL